MTLTIHTQIPGTRARCIRLALLRTLEEGIATDLRKRQGRRGGGRHAGGSLQQSSCLCAGAAPAILTDTLIAAGITELTFLLVFDQPIAARCRRWTADAVHTDGTGDGTRCIDFTLLAVIERAVATGRGRSAAAGRSGGARNTGAGGRAEAAIRAGMS